MIISTQSVEAKPILKRAKMSKPAESTNAVEQMPGTVLMNKIMDTFLEFTPICDLGEKAFVIDEIKNHLLVLFYAKPYPDKVERILKKGHVLSIKLPRRWGKSSLIARFAAALLCCFEGVRIALFTTREEAAEELMFDISRFTRQRKAKSTWKFADRESSSGFEASIMVDGWQKDSRLICRAAPAGIEEKALFDHDVILLDEVEFPADPSRNWPEESSPRVISLCTPFDGNSEDLTEKWPKKPTPPDE